MSLSIIDSVTPTAAGASGTDRQAALITAALLDRKDLVIHAQVMFGRDRSRPIITIEKHPDCLFQDVEHFVDYMLDDFHLTP